MKGNYSLGIVLMKILVFCITRVQISGLIIMKHVGLFMMAHVPICLMSLAVSLSIRIKEVGDMEDQQRKKNIIRKLLLW